MRQLIECVPNFSEGRDRAVLDRIAAAVESVEGVRLLDVDPGKATHRTVFTFVGEPGPVVEAAVRAAREGSAAIDMRRHRGEHPRFGALDVCPLVPVAGITMEETVRHARELARRLGEEVGLSVYCYEYAATRPERKNLADVRAGEYEGLEAKLAQPGWKPDFGPAHFQPKTGATACGARDFLIAYNVDLNTTSVRRANAVAFDVREKGRAKKDAAGRPVVTGEGDAERDPGSLKHVKAIGWFIEEYGIAQISMNLTNIRETPLHVAFDEVCRRADARGLRVTGSELVGLVPLGAMLDAGRYFLEKQRRSVGVSDAELIKIAVRSLGLDELSPFDPEKKIVEYAIRDLRSERLQRRTVQEFVWETASEAPAPGGGSVSALLAALGAALGTMVANLSSHRRGWDERWKEFSDVAAAGKRLHDRALAAIDEDTAAFDGMMTAMRLPKGTAQEAAARETAIEAATVQGIEVPLGVMQLGLDAFEVLEAMAERGMETSLSDVGVGVLCARSAVLGAGLNVRINAASLPEAKRRTYEDEAARRETIAQERETTLLARVRARMARS